MICDCCDTELDSAIIKYNLARIDKYQDKLEKFAPKHLVEIQGQLDEVNARIANFAADDDLFALSPMDLDKNEYLEQEEETL